MWIRIVSLLVACALAVPASAQEPCAGTGTEADPVLAEARREILAWIGARRAEEGLEPLTADAVLCTVAQRRAGDVARAGSVDSTTATVTQVSRRLLSSGYQAHRWTERAILGYRPPVHLVREWSRSGQASYRHTVLGDFEEVGVGVQDAGEGTAVVLLFAVPRISWFREQVKPLEDLEEVRRLALERVNRVRTERGLGAVEADPELDRAAQAHADDMLERGYYGHRSPDGLQPRDWVQRTRYPDVSFLAENIAKGLFEPAETVDRWMDSRDHRRNILHPKARETGLGVAFGDTADGFQVLWVQLFAAPR
jgi:uncharacterized protein YkwD